MTYLNSAEMLLALSGLAGAVHVLAPDHWMPCSITTWQRGWGLRKVLLFQTAALLLHVGFAAAIYFALIRLWPTGDSIKLFELSVGIVVGALFFRVLRFTRMNEIFRRNSGVFSTFMQMLALLGPAESLIPILIKSKQLHVSYLDSTFAFTVGTLLFGVSAALAGRILWNRPLLLPRSLELFTQRTSLLPVTLFVAVGLGYLIKLS